MSHHMYIYIVVYLPFIVVIYQYLFYLSDAYRRRYTPSFIILGIWLPSTTFIVCIWSCLFEMLLKQVKQRNLTEKQILNCRKYGIIFLKIFSSANKKNFFRYLEQSKKFIFFFTGFIREETI